MMILGLLRIGRTSTPADCAIAAAIVVGLGVLLDLSKPTLDGDRQLSPARVLRAAVGAAVLGGVPIAFAFGLGTFALSGAHHAARR